MLGGDSWPRAHSRAFQAHISPCPGVPTSPILADLLASGPLHLLPLRGPHQTAPFHASGHLLREVLHHTHLEKEAGRPPQGPLPTRLPGPYLKCGDDSVVLVHACPRSQVGNSRHLAGACGTEEVHLQTSEVGHGAACRGVSPALATSARRADLRLSPSTAAEGASWERRSPRAWARPVCGQREAHEVGPLAPRGCRAAEGPGALGSVLWALVSVWFSHAASSLEVVTESASARGADPGPPDTAGL